MTTVESKRYWCYVDVCEVGKQFCDHKQLRCTYCYRVAENCFTELHQRNCTQYCNEMLMATLEQPNSQNDSVEWTAFIGWALLILVVIGLAIFFVDKLCCNHKMLDKLKSIICVPADLGNTIPRSRANCQDELENIRGDGEGGETLDNLTGSQKSRKQSNEDTNGERIAFLDSIPTAAQVPNGEFVLASVYEENMRRGSTSDAQTSTLEHNQDRTNASVAEGSRGSHDTLPMQDPCGTHRSIDTTRDNMNNGCAPFREARENSSNESVVRAELGSPAVSLYGEHAIPYQSPRVDSGVGPSEVNSNTEIKVPRSSRGHNK